MANCTQALAWLITSPLSVDTTGNAAKFEFVIDPASAATPPNGQIMVTLNSANKFRTLDVSFPGTLIDDGSIWQHRKVTWTVHPGSPRRVEITIENTSGGGGTANEPWSIQAYVAQPFMGRVTEYQLKEVPPGRVTVGPGCMGF